MVFLEPRPLNYQRKRDDNKNEICVFRGGGVGQGDREELSKTLFFFVGNATTIKFEVKILLSRNFVVMAQAP